MIPIYITCQCGWTSEVHTATDALDGLDHEVGWAIELGEDALDQSEHRAILTTGRV